MRVQLPDGKIAEFPDGMPHAEIERALGEAFGAAAQPQQTAPVPTDAPQGLPEGPTLGEGKPFSQREMFAKIAPLLGSIVGAALAAPSGPLAVAGAGLGAGIGEGVGQLISPKPTPGIMESSKRMVMEGIEGAAGEAGGQAAFKGLEWALPKVLAPFAKKMTPEQRMVEGAVQSGELRGISPDVTSPSSLAKFLRVSSETQPAGALGAWMERRKLDGILGAMHKEALESLPVPNASEAGVTAFKGVKDRMASFGAEYKDGYAHARELAGGPQAPFRTPNLLALAEEMSPTVRDAGFKKKFDSIKKHDGMMTYNDLERYAIWGKNYDNPLQARIRGAALADMGEAVAAARINADKAFKASKEFRANPTVARILKNYGNDPDIIIDTTFRTGNLGDVKLLQEELSPAVWDEMVSRFVETKLLQPAMVKTEASTRFSPNIFATNFDNYAKQLKNVLPEDRFAALERFATLSRASVNDVNRARPGLGSAMQGGGSLLLQIGVPMAMGGGVSMGAIAVPNTFAYMASRSLMKPNGAMRKWLTTGWDGPGQGTKQALQLGGRAVAFGQGEED